jgi:hypothetical protein
MALIFRKFFEEEHVAYLGKSKGRKDTLLAKDIELVVDGRLVCSPRQKLV